MTFSEFKKYIPKIEKIDLFGEKAHLELSPKFRANELKQVNFAEKNPKYAGVMALFYPDKQAETRIVLILRKTYKGVHSAQIGFPGGRAEHIDKDLQETAIRETYEEVGVQPSNIQVVKKLTKIYIPPSNFWVQPFLGHCNHTPNFKRQESEVEQILEVKLTDFLKKESLTSQNVTTSYAKNVEVPGFLLNQHVVWGATGMMLNEVRLLLKTVL